MYWIIAEGINCLLLVFLCGLGQQIPRYNISCPTMAKFLSPFFCNIWGLAGRKVKKNKIKKGGKPSF
jgi:hypothetical protein